MVEWELNSVCFDTRPTDEKREGTGNDNGTSTAMTTLCTKEKIEKFLNEISDCTTFLLINLKLN